MRLSDNRPHRHRLIQATLFMLALALTAFGIAGLAGQAKAGPVSLKFDNGRIGVGVILDDEKILPAPDKFPSASLPTPQRTDITLNGTETDGNLSFPATTNGGSQFPYMFVISPTDPTLRIPLTFRLRDPGLTGTYDAATGQTTLNGNIDIIVITGLGASPLPIPADTATPPLGPFGRCKIPNVPVAFSTETTAPFTAERFKGGFGVNGALTTNWDDLPDVVAENSKAEQKVLCEDQLGVIIHGPGGIWLSNAVLNPAPQPVVEPTCADDLRLCPLPTFVEISALSLKPKMRTAKPGQTRTFKVKVRNTGTEDSTGTVVRLRSSNKRVKVRRKIKLNVPAGSVAVKKVMVRVKRKARGKARITATTEGIRRGAGLKVKSSKKSKKRRKK